MAEHYLDCWESLAMAIVKQAVIDYVAACQSLVRDSEKQLSGIGTYTLMHIMNYNDSKRFFANDCNGIISADGEAIIRKVNERNNIDADEVERALESIEGGDKMARRRNLKIFRVENDLTQEQMAEILGVTRMTYASVENGVRQGSMKMWKRLKDEFDIPSEDMYRLMEEG